MGPVHARIALHGGAARVTLWAEDAETAAKLTAHQGELCDALLADQLEPQVQVVSGAPSAQLHLVAAHFEHFDGL